MATADILMITFNSPGYVRMSLPRLLESCDDQTRIWLWHNGADEETLEVTKSFSDDPRVYRFHHSPENVGLADPTNWVWAEGDGAFVSKVDDDCLLPVDWITRLRDAHSQCDEFGAIGASRLRPEDIRLDLLAKKREQHGGVEITRSHWVQGSGYLLKRKFIEHQGPLTAEVGWTNYCLGLAKLGAINGFLQPLIFEDHMDDPRSPNTLLHTDEDLAWRMPLSMKRSNVKTLDDWQRRLERSALEIQQAPNDLRSYSGMRSRVRNLRARLDQYRKA